MKYSKILLAALLGLVVLIAAVVLWQTLSGKTSDDSEDFPAGTAWLCGDCGKGFRKSISELHEIYRDRPGAPVPCPHCGKTNTVRAKQCPHCSAYFERAARDRNPEHTGRPVCPKCGKALPRLAGRR